MKTSKEMQLKIIDKMRSNLVDGKYIFDGIEYYGRCGSWIGVHRLTGMSFEIEELRIRRETITINGVEIPKPLSSDNIEFGGYYFIPSRYSNVPVMVSGSVCIDQSYFFVYERRCDAVEASRLLYGVVE